MIRFKIKELIAEKEFRERRKITLQEVADSACVNRTALSKMMNPSYEYSTTTKAIDSLCHYFCCKVEDVIEYVED
ncbi:MULTISPECIES: helix-turn-helix domain-containing protein [Shewanella]|uniref:helix-turn-helix domain-containing protein n=1 Tax=Shewanella TaxID=22 RepID=UPI001CF18152|nr:MULTISPECIES: helix-turn-helix domain-containing protein [Shewanella]MCB2381400.1 helix-turn-helix domain-containing protein [Shewanella sp. SR1]MCS6098792.1 helix-turn-helix domain-containing protein [Shewanella baltica]MCS6182252.1 helix-turn-helix domain-containing protein [Shewanella baltica]MCU7997409.1 helix-turn-helix domain-containing protein [Shewanella sp. SM95]MCU8029549.1 helix-turn-helix domain-containing protein [Shewanella sp. SM73]